MQLERVTDNRKKSQKNIYTSLSPLDGSSLGTFKETSVKDLTAKIAATAGVRQEWAEKTHKERLSYLKKIRSAFAEKVDQLVEIVHRETGKVIPEIYGGEIIANLELIDFYIKNSGKILRPEKVAINPINYPKKTGYIHHRPVGLVGVVSSWNYPVALPMRAIVPALIAGNGVLFKPSAEATLTGEAIAEVFQSVLPEGLFISAYGNKEVNEAVADNSNKVNFIGSVNVGKAMAKRCADRLIPCSTELSGKDAAIVLEDANLERAIQGIIWGAFTNTGQNCASIERVFVTDVIYDEFVHRIVEKTQKLKGGADYGPLRNSRQLKLVNSHIENARKNGGKILCGGKVEEKGSLYFEPTVIAVGNTKATYFNEETFGPTLPIYKVKDLQEATTLANSVRFGLTASIWTSDIKKAQAWAANLEAGVVMINNSVFTGALTASPWGGVKDTGHGVTNSKYGLLEMTRPAFVLTDKSKAPKESWWYPYTPESHELFREVTMTLRGKISSYLKVPGLLKKVLGNKL